MRLTTSPPKRLVIAAIGCLALTACAQQPGPHNAKPDLAQAIAAHPTLPQLADGQDSGAIVSFPSGDKTLSGYLYRPKGAGPFKAVIWNHGNEPRPGAQPELARFYTAHGFVFFVPHRTGHGRSAGVNIRVRIAELRRTGSSRDAYRSGVVSLLDADNDDVVAATEWLKSQPFVEPNRIAMSGYSFGGIQTLLSAEKGLGVRAFVSFSPGAMAWRNARLQQRLLDAVRNAKAPVFLIQARNDFSTGPSDTLGPEIRKRGGLNKAVLYPKFGTTLRHAHRGFATWNVGTRVWGADVLHFLEAALGESKRAGL